MKTEAKQKKTRDTSLHRLDTKTVEHAPYTGKDYVMADGGNLYLHVRRYEKKEWLFRYLSPVTRKRRNLGLGRFPDTSLKTAREIAAEKRKHLSQNLDPIEIAEGNKRKAKKQIKEQKRKEENTVEKLFGDWKDRELQNRKLSGREETVRSFKKDVFPVIGKMPVSEVTRDDIRKILDRPLKRGSNRMANRLLSDLKQFFGYLEDEELVAIQPTRRMIKSRVGGKEEPRARTLSEEERVKLIKTLPSSGLSQKYQCAVWIMISTCCRVDELSRAKWSDIDFDKRIFKIPVDHAKNREAHEIYLSDFALKHFKELSKEKSSVWIYPNRQGGGCIHRQTINKQIKDRQRENGVSGRTKENTSLILLNGNWTVHDLRRTGATIMQEIGVFPYIVKKCLNQKEDDRITATYQTAALKKEQKQAFIKLGDYLSHLYEKNQKLI